MRKKRNNKMNSQELIFYNDKQHNDVLNKNFDFHFYL